ncbi:unnamed protein product [Sphenostylis stenocarpa]|uniref:Uncharacterized protein n=1 Tax=Sphenostylis stenocarpa TaxID=92480 RepID=A0AA86SDA7_9FABA|nr:unnamed protein product [Sphenostylis stenocarpa]
MEVCLLNMSCLVSKKKKGHGHQEFSRTDASMASTVVQKSTSPKNEKDESKMFVLKLSHVDDEAW